MIQPCNPWTKSPFAPPVERPSKCYLTGTPGILTIKYRLLVGLFPEEIVMSIRLFSGILLFCFITFPTAAGSNAWASGCSDVDQCSSSTCKVKTTTYHCKSGEESEYKLAGFPPQLVEYRFATCQCPAGKNPKKYRKQISPSSAEPASTEIVESNGEVSTSLTIDPACGN